MEKIYLARHGQNEDNVESILNGRRDRPLTPLGIEQALELAKHIQDEGITFSTILSSPLSRARQTADVIAKEVGNTSIEVEPLLIERDFGVMTGKKSSDIEALCAPDILKTDTVTYFLCPEGAETFPDLMLRAKKIIEKVREKYPQESVLLVAHGDIGKMLYATYYNLPWEDVLRNFHFGNSELLLLSPDSPADETHVFSQEQFNH